LRLQSPLPIREDDIELPDGSRLAPDEFIVRTGRDWGMRPGTAALTTRRLVSQSDPSSNVKRSTALADIISVSLRKAFIGFETISVETVDGERLMFPAHVNGSGIRFDINTMVRFARTFSSPGPSG
jgi:hypothetical protein